MPQLFKRHFVLMLKLAFLAAALLIIAAIFAWRVYTGPPSHHQGPYW